jgi:hypothetical protein
MAVQYSLCTVLLTEPVATLTAMIKKEMVKAPELTLTNHTKFKEIDFDDVS